MTHALTRRGLVAAAPAAIVAATMPAHAVGNPDAELLALREPFQRTWDIFQVALREFSAAEAEASNSGKLPIDDSRRIEAERRFRAADERCDVFSDANHAIVAEMCRLEARTIEGLAFKARVSLEHEDNRYEELVTSIMDDILAMAGLAHA